MNWWVNNDTLGHDVCSLCMQPRPQQEVINSGIQALIRSREFLPLALLQSSHPSRMNVMIYLTLFVQVFHTGISTTEKY